MRVTLVRPAALFLAAVFLGISLVGNASAAERIDDPLSVEISTGDVAAFYAIYDAADGRPDAEALQLYIDGGSPGVQGFIANRIVSAENLAAVVRANRHLYDTTRECASALGGVRERVRAAFLAMKELYPEATFPTVYIVIGANNTGGTANSAALMIGLEVVCRPSQIDASPIDVRLTHLIAHEAVHALEQGFGDGSLLSRSLGEGIAEFIGALSSGRPLNAHLFEWTQGREAELEQRFAEAMYGSNSQAWLYNGRGTREAPGDLGYWVGYRIACAYYERASDKRRAISDLLKSTSAREIMARSGWGPGRLCST